MTPTELVSQLKELQDKAKTLDAEYAKTADDYLDELIVNFEYMIDRDAPKTKSKYGTYEQQVCEQYNSGRL